MQRWRVKSPGVRGGARFAKYAGDATAAMRILGPMGIAIMRIYKNREIAKADASEYIGSFYNRKRRHSHLGGVSPEEFEAAVRESRKRVY